MGAMQDAYRPQARKGEFRRWISRINAAARQPAHLPRLMAD
jgi:ribosomal protein L20